MSRTRALAVLVAVAGMLSGCASIPESTPVEVVGDNVGSSDEGPPIAPPAPGLDQLEVVRRFVEAGASQTNQHQAARAYLTAEAATVWDDTRVTYVVEDVFDTVPIASLGTGADRQRQVDLRMRQHGRLTPTGVFQLDRGELRFTVTLVRQANEWRIVNPPDGLLIRHTDFRSSYRVVGVSFVDPAVNVLVNDRRWVLSHPESAVPGRVVNLLFGDPSDDLKGAVLSELRGARARTNVAPGPDDVLTVDLTGVPDLNDTQRQLAAAQIVSSVDEVAQSRPVRILVDNEDLTPGRQQWRPADVKAMEPPVELSPGLPGLVVNSAGKVVQIGSDRELPGIPPSMVVQSVAQSPVGERLADGPLAVVGVEAGRPQLWVGPPNAMQPVDLTATTMTEPTWRRARSEAWTVVDGNRLVAVTVGDGVPRARPVDVSELSRHGKISALRFSRDGVRIAAVVNNQLALGSVVGVDNDTISVRNVRLLPPPNPAHLVDVDWVGTELLMAATANRDTPVYEHSVDGFSWRPFGTSNLTPPINRIAAVSGRPVLVADQTGVWSAVAANSVWQPAGHGAGDVPAYPG